MNPAPHHKPRPPWEGEAPAEPNTSQAHRIPRRTTSLTLPKYDPATRHKPRAPTAGVRKQRDRQHVVFPRIPCLSVVKSTHPNTTTTPVGFHPRLGRSLALTRVDRLATSLALPRPAPANSATVNTSFFRVFRVFPW